MTSEERVEAWTKLAAEYKSVDEGDAEEEGYPLGMLKVLVAGEWWEVDGFWISSHYGAHNGFMMSWRSGRADMCVDVNAIQGMKWIRGY
jgi:hypothetical protein